MASPEFGDRDAFGLKLGPAGAVVQVFQMRRGRVVERIELVTDPVALGSLDDASRTVRTAPANRRARTRRSDAVRGRPAS